MTRATCLPSELVPRGTGGHSPPIGGGSTSARHASRSEICPRGPHADRCDTRSHPPATGPRSSILRTFEIFMSSNTAIDLTFGTHRASAPLEGNRYPDLRGSMGFRPSRRENSNAHVAEWSHP